MSKVTIDYSKWPGIEALVNSFEIGGVRVDAKDPHALMWLAAMGVMFICEGQGEGQPEATKELIAGELIDLSDRLQSNGVTH
jgi:hypothetical protein